MNEQSTKQKTTTGEPVEGQAPAPSTVPASTTTAPTSLPAKSEPAPAPGALPQIPSGPASPGPQTLPPGYLSSGSMLDEAGILIPEYIGKYAQELAKALTPFKASTFQRAFLSGAKEARRKKIPYSAKKNCAQGMEIAALKLVNRTRDPAPGILLEMIRAATATVKDPATFEALYMHLDAVYSYLLSE